MWQKKNNHLYQKFTFKNFDEAFDFIKKVADIARGLNHHPKIVNSYNVVELSLSTHSAGDIVTEKDHALAKKIDEIISQKPIKKIKGLTKAKLFTDGGSRGNPGPSATGFVILDLDGNVVKKAGEYIGESTNNQAEYTALKKGLAACKTYGVKSIDVYMDSELIINQLNGKYKIKNQGLKPLYENVKKIEKSFDNINYSHVPREQNSIADGLVNEAMDNVL